MRGWCTTMAALLVVPVRLGSQEPKDTVPLNPVVVTATRVAMPASDVPVGVTVLRGTDLAAQGVASVLEALRDVPGATVVQTGSFGGQTSLFLRGGQSNYVKVLVDGVPVNQPGGTFDFANLTTDNIERIEVVRGPASVLYGSDAVTGVVQIFTRPGTASARATVRARGGTYGTLAVDAEAAGGTHEAGYSVSVSHFSSNGIYAFNNRYLNTVVSGLARAAPDEGTEATLTLRYGDAIFHFPTNGSGVPVDPTQFTYGSGPSVGFAVRRSLAPRVDLRLLLATSETTSGFDDAPDSAAGDSSRFQNLDDLRRSSADLQANVHLPAGSVLTVGATVEDEHYRGFNVCQTSFGDCTTPPVAAARRNAAVYGQLGGVELGPVSLTAGSRLEDNERFGTYATVRLGAIYRLSADTRVRASAGNAFREPAFGENYSTGYTVGNPNLKPEHSRSWELGLEQSLVRGRASLSATFFDQRFLDMIDYNPNVAVAAPNYYNLAAATANGVELGLRYASTGPLWATASYTYLHTDVTNPGFDSSSGALLATGQPLIRRPKHAGRLDLGYELRQRGTVSLAATYVGDRADRIFPPFPAPPSRITLPSYLRVDVAATFVLRSAAGGTPGLAVTARVENALDHAYEEVKHFPARRRTIFVGGELRFGSR